MVSSYWTFEDFASLIRYIVNSDELFRRSQKQNFNLSFWTKVSNDFYYGKRLPELVWHRWKKAERIYQQIEALESIAGGDGDDELTTDDEGDEETIVDEHQDRLARVQKRKPCSCPHCEVKTVEQYGMWFEGGENSLYEIMHMRFKGVKPLARKTHYHSGSISPYEEDSVLEEEESVSEEEENVNGEEDNSDDEEDGDNHEDATSGFETNTSHLDWEPEVQADKTIGRPVYKSSGEALGVLSSQFLATSLELLRAHLEMSTQRLEFEQAQIEMNYRLELEKLQTRNESRKRKLSNDRRMDEMKEAEAKRRRKIEADSAEEQCMLARVQLMNKCLDDPSTYEGAKPLYRSFLNEGLAKLDELRGLRDWSVYLFAQSILVLNDV